MFSEILELYKEDSILLLGLLLCLTALYSKVTELILVGIQPDI